MPRKKLLKLARQGRLREAAQEAVERIWPDGCPEGDCVEKFERHLKELVEKIQS